MATYPILFNDEMVRAILDGRKSATRRLIKPQTRSAVVRHLGEWQETEACANGIRVLQPPYQIGDILYVRECWAIAPDLQGIVEAGPVYRADYMEREVSHLKDKHFRWRPSIHMKKEMARIFLKVKSIRVERLHQMGIADFAKEGVIPRKLNPRGCECAWKTENCRIQPCANRDAYEAATYYWPFSELWDSTIHKKERDVYGYSANPWVWVIEFEPCEKPEGF